MVPPTPPSVSGSPNHYAHATRAGLPPLLRRGGVSPSCVTSCRAAAPQCGPGAGQRRAIFESSLIGIYDRNYAPYKVWSKQSQKLKVLKN